MHPDNPFRTVSLTLPEDLRLRLDAPLVNAPGGLTAWHWLEWYFERCREPIDAHDADLALIQPPSLRNKAEASLTFTALQATSAVLSATQVGLQSAGSYLSAIESALLGESLLPAAALMRALLEHTIEVEALARQFVDSDILRWAVEPNYVQPEDTLPAPLELAIAARKCIYAGRFDFAADYAVGPLAKRHLDAAEKRLPDLDKKRNIKSFIEEAEKRRRRPHLSAHWARLCDCVHPSRGTRESLTQSTLAQNGVTIGRRFSAQSVSPKHFSEKVKHFLAPGLLETFLSIVWFQEEFTPVLKERSTIFIRRLASHGLDVDALLEEATEHYVRTSDEIEDDVH